MTEYSLEFVRSSRRELERLPATGIERVIRVVRDLARGALGRDDHGYRAEFVRLAAIARGLD